MTTAQRLAPEGTRYPGLLMVEAFETARARKILTGNPDTDRGIVARLLTDPEVQKQHAARMAAVDEAKRRFMAGPQAASAS